MKNLSICIVIPKEGKKGGRGEQKIRNKTGQTESKW